jgi:hypothetical protein
MVCSINIITLYTHYVQGHLQFYTFSRRTPKKNYIYILLFYYIYNQTTHVLIRVFYFF